MELNYNILIVEDEMMIATHIEQILQEENFSCVGIAKSYTEAISYLERSKNIDFVLLDVSLYGEQTGIDLACTINECYNLPFFYLTSYSDRTTLTDLKGTGPVGYLSKPVDEIELVTALQIAGANLERKKFTFKLGSERYTIVPDDLRYIKSDHVYVDLFLGREKLTLRTPLGNMIMMLPEGCVKRVNRSVAVNPRYIKKVSGGVLYVDDVSFKISPKYREHFN